MVHAATEKTIFPTLVLILGRSGLVFLHRCRLRQLSRVNIVISSESDLKHRNLMRRSPTQTYYKTESSPALSKTKRQRVICPLIKCPDALSDSVVRQWLIGCVAVAICTCLRHHQHCLASDGDPTCTVLIRHRDPIASENSVSPWTWHSPPRWNRETVTFTNRRISVRLYGRVGAGGHPTWLVNIRGQFHSGYLRRRSER